MSIKVINGGLLATVQDKGRYGFQAGGVQVSGVMDRDAAELANFLVGNEPEAAVLETTYLGPELEFAEAALVAATGGLPDMLLDGKKVEPYRSLVVRQGQRLKLAAQKSGMRAYIAVAGGLAVPKVMGSRSTNLKLAIGGLAGRKLQAGDELPTGQPGEYAQAVLAGTKRPRVAKLPEALKPENVQPIRIILGPQDDYFSQEEIERFCQEIYTVSNESDRMGYRLQGRPVAKTNNRDLITDGIVFGSIQIPPNGQPIIMLADHQTTGGYPKLATVATVDLPKLAQAMPGTKLQFSLVTVQAAQKLLRQQYKEQQDIFRQIAAEADKPILKPSGKAKKLHLRVNGEDFDVTVEEIK